MTLGFPILGRFNSPDPFIPHPYNPQSLNRYAYCLNNPLIYTDPSGYEDDAVWLPEITSTASSSSSGVDDIFASFYWQAYANSSCVMGIIVIDPSLFSSSKSTTTSDTSPSSSDNNDGATVEEVKDPETEIKTEVESDEAVGNIDVQNSPLYSDNLLAMEFNIGTEKILSEEVQSLPGHLPDILESTAETLDKIIHYEILPDVDGDLTVTKTKIPDLGLEPQFDGLPSESEDDDGLLDGLGIEYKLNF